MEPRDQLGGEQATSRTWAPWPVSDDHKGGLCPQRQGSEFPSGFPEKSQNLSQQSGGPACGDRAASPSAPGGSAQSIAGFLNFPLTPNPLPASCGSLGVGWHPLGRPQEGLLPQTAEPGPRACGLWKALTVNMTPKCFENKTIGQQCVNV